MVVKLQITWMCWVSFSVRVFICPDLAALGIQQSLVESLSLKENNIQEIHLKNVAKLLKARADAARATGTNVTFALDLGFNTIRNLSTFSGAISKIPILTRLSLRCVGFDLKGFGDLCAALVLR